MKLHEDNRK